MPTSEPEPWEAVTRALLADRGLWLYRDPDTTPGAHTRHGVGYVCDDPEVIALAHLVRHVAATAGVHPMTLAVQWTATEATSDG